MLVKRALIWVWQGNQQPNSTVKLNSGMEHRRAGFMLRLQKGKVPQHQFVTESSDTELAIEAARKRERRRGSFVCGWESVASEVTPPTSSKQQLRTPHFQRREGARGSRPASFSDHRLCITWRYSDKQKRGEQSSIIFLLFLHSGCFFPEWLFTEACRLNGFSRRPPWDLHQQTAFAF